MLWCHQFMFSEVCTPPFIANDQLTCIPVESKIFKPGSVVAIECNTYQACNVALLMQPLVITIVCTNYICRSAYVR